MLRPPEPSCLPSAPAITNFFPPHLIPIHLFLFPRPPSLISTPLRLPSVVSLSPPLSLVLLSFLFLSPFRLIRLPPLHLPLYSHFSGIFISISLSVRGRGGRVSFREDGFFCRHADALTHTHTLENTLKLARLSIVSQCVAVAWWAAAKLDVIKCNWCSELEKRE